MTIGCDDNDLGSSSARGSGFLLPPAPPPGISGREVAEVDDSLSEVYHRGLIFILLNKLSFWEAI
jgi:hypothetical protein